MPNDRRLRAIRAEQQRLRIIELLEQAVDADHTEQCPDCGEFYAGLSQHRPHCDGPGE